jgi:glycerophosphoryl diester phosphodiesterase
MILLAHRGASGYAPENTLGALKKAVELGAKAMEIDVQLTKDGKAVVIHDYFLDRLTDKTGFIKDLTLAEIKEARVKNRFSEEYNDEQVPTLEEFLAALPKDVFLNVEVKAMALDKREIEDEIIKILRANYPMENIAISSFNHPLLKRVNDKYPDVKIGMLLGNALYDLPQYIKDTGIKLFSINYGRDNIDPADVKAFKEQGYKIFVYTVNDIPQANMFREMGVDGIFCDYTDMLD